MAADAYARTLHHITLGLLARRDLGELLENVISSAGQIAHTTNVYIALVDEETNLIRPMVTMGVFRDQTLSSLKSGEGLSGRVWQSGAPLMVKDYDSWEGRLPSFSLGVIQSIVGIPLKSDARTLGVLGLAHDRQSQRAFSQEEIELLSQFAALATLTIENVRLYQSATQAADRRAILYRASQEVSAGLDIEQVCAAVHRAVQQVMPCEDFIVAFYDEARHEIIPVYIIETPRRRVTAPPYAADRGLGGHIVRTGQSVRLNSPEQILSSGIVFVPYGNGPVTSSVLGVPMWLKGRIVGMLSAQSYQPRAYSADDQELLEMLAAHAAVAFDNARLFAETQLLAITDSLTEAFNRRHLLALAEREFERARRYTRPLSLIMLDVDDFKKINDTFGHQAGDRVLQIVAKRCRQVLREVDIFGRYGGDEFAIVLPETDIARAQLIAGRLCRQFVRMETDPNQTTAAGVTVSVGMAFLDPTCPSLGALLDRADQALYAAKQAGRNRVSIWRAV